MEPAIHFKSGSERSVGRSTCGIPGEHAHLYLQNGAHRVIQIASGLGWRSYDVLLDVPNDAASLEIGFAYDGEGSAELDAVSLSALPSQH